MRRGGCIAKNNRARLGFDLAGRRAATPQLALQFFNRRHLVIDFDIGHRRTTDKEEAGQNYESL